MYDTVHCRNGWVKFLSLRLARLGDALPLPPRCIGRAGEAQRKLPEIAVGLLRLVQVVQMKAHRGRQMLPNLHLGGPSGWPVSRAGAYFEREMLWAILGQPIDVLLLIFRI